MTTTTTHKERTETAMKKSLILLLLLSFLLTCCTEETQETDPTVTDPPGTTGPSFTLPVETAPPYTVPAVTEPEPTDTALIIPPVPTLPTGDELYQDRTGFHYPDGYSAMLYSENFAPGLLYVIHGNTATQVVDQPVTDFTYSVHYLFCATADGQILQVSYDGSVCNHLYTSASGSLAHLEYSAGMLYFVDGNQIMEVDIPAGTSRILHRQEDVIQLFLLEGNCLAFRVAGVGGESSQCYALNLATGEIEKNRWF